MHFDAFLRAVAKNEFAPAYLLAGAELFFRDKAREALVKFYLDGRPEDLVERDLAEVAVRDALDDAATPGLFAPRRVVWLRNADALLARRGPTSEETALTSGRHSPEAITAYLGRPNPEAIVVFEARTDDKERIARLEKLLAGSAKVELGRAAAPEAVRYLIEEAGRAGFTLDRGAAAELVEATGDDLARARTELEKLMAYAAGRGAITAEDVRELVPAEPAYIIWELGDSIGRGDVPGALERLGALLRDGHKPLAILGLIASHIRKLLRAKAGGSEWLPQEIRRQAQKIPQVQLLAALDRLFRADVELRSSPPDERLVLERLVLDLTGRK